MQVAVDGEGAAGRTLDLPRDRAAQHVPVEEIDADRDESKEYSEAAEPVFCSSVHGNVAYRVSRARLLHGRFEA